MLKSLAILALLAFVAVGFLAGQKTPTHTPKQGVGKASSGQNGSGHSQTQNSKETTSNIVSPSQKPTSQTCDEACQQGRQNLAIQRKLEWFTGVLAIVGVLQVLTMIWQTTFLWGTLKAVQIQAGHMDKQNRAAQEKERARIVVKIIPDKLPIIQILWQVKFQVENIGPSHAFDVWLDAKFEFTSSPIPPPIPISVKGVVMHLPRIRAEKRRYVLTGPVVWEENGFIKWNEKRMQGVADGKTFLHLRGSINYQDIFGESHVTPFRYIWNADIDSESQRWGESNPGWVEAFHQADPKAT